MMKQIQNLLTIPTCATTLRHRDVQHLLPEVLADPGVPVRADPDLPPRDHQRHCLPPGLLRGREVVENKHSTEVEPPPSPPPPASPPPVTSPPPRGNLLLLLCASVRAFTLTVSHAPTSAECLFSMTLLRGVRHLRLFGHPRLAHQRGRD